jgi:peptidoglycan biosynthesis protein MviN/MurJ (putative lipid II flippase)
VLRAHIVRVILGTGAFDWNDTRLTAALLAILVVGLVAQGLILLFSRALYAVRQSWRPLLYQLAGGVLTVVLALVFLMLSNTGLLSTIAALLRVGNVPGIAILLLALAATLGQLFLLVLSLIALRSVVPGFTRMLVRPFFDGLAAALVGGIATYVTLAIEGGIAPLTGLVSVFLQGFFAGIVGLAVAALTLFYMKNEEFKSVMQAFDKLMHSQGPAAVLVPSADEPAQP